MKAEAKIRLIKDVILIVAAWIVGGAIFYAGLSGKADFLTCLSCGFIFAGVPFGWRWMSKVFSAAGFFTLIVKGLLSLVLGWLAVFVVLIGDTVSFVKAEA